MNKALLVVLLLTVPAAAQAQTAGVSPEGVARRYMAAATKNDWRRVASLFDPVELKTLKDAMMPIYLRFYKTKKPGPFKLMLEGIRSETELKALSPRDLFGRFLTAIFNSQPNLRTTLAGGKFRIIGRGEETPTLVHLVYRLAVKIQNEPIEAVQVVSLVKRDDGWRVRLGVQFANMVRAFKRLLAEP